jgi:rhodanese-related sulfurtransferase
MSPHDDDAHSAISQIDPSEALAQVDRGATLLDVRTPEEFAAGHAPQARFIPLAELEARAQTLSLETTLAIICRSGHRSQNAAEYLRAQGFQVSNVVGGMTAWAAEGLPIIDDHGGPGQVV